jgi:hypothetical protein
MSAREIKVKIGYQILSDCLGVMTVGLFYKKLTDKEWTLGKIVAGESYDMLHRLDKW